MFIIWRGRGWVVFALVIAALLVTQFVVDGAGGEDTYTENATLWAGVALAVTGAGVHLLASRWHRPDRVVVDEASGERLLLRADDALMFVPMRFWAVILGSVGVVMAAAGVL